MNTYLLQGLATARIDDLVESRRVRRFRRPTRS